MAANVFFVIIPAHWELVRAKKDGREPDPKWNARGKQRSVHNNYLTLPVVLCMISGHLPFTYGHSHAWLILVVLMALGAFTRHYFNLRHRGKDEWWILAGAAFGVIALAILIRPDSSGSTQAAGPAPAFGEVQSIVTARCVPCHSQNPTQPGFAAPGAGILLVTREQIESQADLIRAVAVDTQTMPLGNATKMTDEERQTLANWLASR
jgi:uncharacterized membrane protein